MARAKTITVRTIELEADSDQHIERVLRKMVHDARDYRLDEEISHSVSIHDHGTKATISVIVI